MKIELVNLYKTYVMGGKALEVLSGVNFTFPSGKSIAVMGRSGVGKSTLLQLLGGLDGPTSGSVIYGEQDLAKLSQFDLARFRGQNIGFVFQFHHLLPEFSAEENVMMPLVIAGHSEGEALTRSRSILERVGLGERARHRPGQLSGGEQQRVAIARALVGNPAVVLADEPTGSLDVTTAEEVRQLLIDLNREMKSTLVVVTHSQELAQGLEYIVDMSPGGHLAERSRESLSSHSGVSSRKV